MENWNQTQLFKKFKQFAQKAETDLIPAKNSALHNIDIIL